jgi:hypothetical protein
VTCAICDYSYLAGHAEEETAHAHYHDEWVNGCEFPAISGERIVGAVLGLPLLEAAPELPSPYRQRFWNVARRARERTSFPTPYDGGEAEWEWDGRAYVVRKEGRAIAFCVVRLRSEGCWWLAWSDYDPGPSRIGMRDVVPRRVVEFAWVLSAEQQRGLGTAMIREIARRFGIAVPDLGWTLDFTRPGEALVRSLTGAGFWADK